MQQPLYCIVEGSSCTSLLCLCSNHYIGLFNCVHPYYLYVVTTKLYCRREVQSWPKKPAKKKPHPKKRHLKWGFLGFNGFFNFFFFNKCLFFALKMIKSSRNKVYYQLYCFLEIHSTKTDAFIHFLRLKPMILTK